MDPLNTKVVGRDGRSHASAGPASDFALSLSGRSRDLALEARLSPPEPYLWHGEELSEVRCASSLLRGSRIAGRGALVLQLYFSASLSIVRLLGFSLMVTSPD